MSCLFNLVYYSCKKVHDGVLHAAKLYPNAYIIMVIVGTLKGIIFYAQWCDFLVAVVCNALEPLTKRLYFYLLKYITI